MVTFFFNKIFTGKNLPDLKNYKIMLSCYFNIIVDKTLIFLVSLLRDILIRIHTTLTSR